MNEGISTTKRKMGQKRECVVERNEIQEPLESHEGTYHARAHPHI